MPPLPPPRPSPCTEVSEVTMRETQPPIAPEAIVAALSQITDPDLGRDIVTLGFVKDLKIDGESVSFAIELTTPACPVRDQMKEDAQRTVLSIPGVTHVAVVMSSKVRGSQSEQKDELIPLVKNVVPVSSGKGGVGKSTVATNLAVALAKLGARVGLMDADIYGPNIPRMMGINQPLQVDPDARIIPLEAHGIKLVSIGFLIERDQPAIWRGPIIMKVITQFLRDVNWGQLDFLIVDMPPGTGDAQLSLVQATHVSGAVIVTTPQQVAAGDALRGAKMFQRVDVPVIGVIENMSWFQCPHCGKPVNIFGTGGGERLATELGVPLLGKIPLYPQVLAGGDLGLPIVVGEPESAASKALLQTAE